MAAATASDAPVRCTPGSAGEAHDRVPRSGRGADKAARRSELEYSVKILITTNSSTWALTRRKRLQCSPAALSKPGNCVTNADERPVSQVDSHTREQANRARIPIALGPAGFRNPGRCSRPSGDLTREQAKRAQKPVPLSPAGVRNRKRCRRPRADLQLCTPVPCCVQSTQASFRRLTPDDVRSAHSRFPYCGALLRPTPASVTRPSVASLPTPGR